MARTAYDKGATVAHNLRTYMGDEAFFEGFHSIQENYAFKDIDAADFRDALDDLVGSGFDSIF
jgi:aminopeptidase N